VSSLLLAHPQAARDLAAFAGRLAAADADAVVRVVARGARVGCFAATPFEVLVLRAAVLAEPLTLDEVVEAGTLAARAASATPGDATTRLELPPPVPALRWTGSLPPTSGWAPRGTIALDRARELVAGGIEEFRARVAAVPEADRSRAVLESIAADVWEREEPPGVRVRLLHAASAYGFLADPPTAADRGQDADATASEVPGVAVAAAGRWTRVAAPYGTVLAREGSALDLLIG
jgi:hypothetical protein